VWQPKRTQHNAAPPWVGSRSPDGWDQIPQWAGGWACTSHPGVLGSIPKREEPGKTGAPCVKVPGSSRVPAPPWVGSRSPDGWDQIPRWAGGWACTSHPGVLGSIPKREEPGKTGAPCVKVPGSSRVPVRDGQTHPHRPRLVVSHSTCPPLSSSPNAHSFVIGPAVIKHTCSSHQRTVRLGGANVDFRVSRSACAPVGAAPARAPTSLPSSSLSLRVSLSTHS
jgi:hypothetical protein